jgi:hypothetical protein
VVPALMLFRAFVLKQRVRVDRYSLDAHSSTGHSTSHEIPIVRSARIPFSSRANQQFGLQNLKTWLDETSESVPY